MGPSGTLAMPRTSRNVVCCSYCLGEDILDLGARTTDGGIQHDAHLSNVLYSWGPILFAIMLWLLPSAVYAIKRRRMLSLLDGVMLVLSLLITVVIVLPDTFFTVSR